MSEAGRPAARSRPIRLGRALRWCLVGALVVLPAAASRAHNLGDSYLYLQIYEESVSGRFEIALSDLNPALGLSGTELEITAENLDQRVGFLREYYLERVAISDGPRPLSIDFREHGFLRARGGYVLLPFDLGGLDGGVPDSLTIDYSILFDEEPSHRGFLLVEHNWATGTFANENRVSLIFSPSSRRQEFDLTSSGRLRGFLAIVRLGAEHVFLGLDHLVFLVALLLPVALRREAREWRAVESFAPVLRNVVTIVTALVVAHGVALGLVALAGIRLPERLVETAIAASIVLAAGNLLLPLFRGRVWWIILGLGLFHGFGFAGGLLDLGVLDEHLGMSLVAFNLGVEAAQLLIVVVLFPLLFWVRRLAPYRKLALPVAAVSMILLSGVWVVERGFDADVPLRELLPPAVQKVIP